MSAPLSYAGHTWESAREWCLWIMRHNSAPAPAQRGQEAALDAFRDEVLHAVHRTVPEAYPGELAMLRGVVGVLRTVVRAGDLAECEGVRELRRLVAEHYADERAAYAEAEEKTTTVSTTAGAAVTPEPSRDRIERYTSALRDADPYALVERRDDLARLANAAMTAADNELDQVYRDAYGTGREHAGAPGWLLNNFEAVTSTSGGSYGVAEEYRCRTCGAIGAQGTDDQRTLLDLVSMASRHKCLPSLPDGA